MRVMPGRGWPSRSPNPCTPCYDRLASGMEPMKTLLIPVDDPGSQAQLETALLVATAFGSHMDGIAPRAVLNAALYGDGFTPALQEWDLREDERVARAQRMFRAFIDGRGIRWAEAPEPSDQPSAGWIADGDRANEVVEQMARLYDMTVVAHPAANASSRTYEVLESILFESGRPILIAPGEAPQSLGRTVVIAWNGSTESARAISFARPFLDRAQQVHVLSIEGGMVAGPNAQQVQTSLARSGIAAETHVVGQHGRSTGEAILEETAKLGADLLVKGAYTHSRLRQLIFGGATSHILEQATLPVLMAH